MQLYDKDSTDNLLAAKKRRLQAEPHIRAAAWFEELADLLPVGRKVGEYFPEVEIGKLYQEYIAADTDLDEIPAEAVA